MGERAEMRKKRETWRRAAMDVQHVKMQLLLNMASMCALSGDSLGREEGRYVPCLLTEKPLSLNLK